MMHRQLRAPDHARPQAAAEIVGAEHEVGAGRTEFEAHRQLGRVDRRDPRRESRRQQDDAEQAEPGDEQPVMEQALQRRPRGMLARDGNVAVEREFGAAPLFIAHPRVEQRVADVDADIDQHEQRRDQEQPALHHRIVPVQHRLRQQLADAGNGEQRLRHHRAGDQQADDDARPPW